MGLVIRIILILAMTFGVTTTARADDGVAPYTTALSRAAYEISIGNFPAAVRSGRAAFALARNDNEQVGAARLVASAHFRAGHYSRAEWWLRRALHNADDSALPILGQEFNAVRQKNPLRLRLNFSLAPSGNINNGSASQTVTIWDLPFVLNPDARALSGVEMALGVDAIYNIARGRDFATDLGVILFGRTYELSPSARKTAPGVSGSDYGFAAAEVSIRHTRRFSGTSGPSVFALHIGKNWYGGAPYTNYQRARFSQEFRPDNATAWQIFSSLEHQISIRDANTPSRIFALGTSFTRKLGNGDGLRVSLQAQQTTSGDPAKEYSALKSNLHYGFARPILGNGLSLSATLEARDYEYSVYDPSGRQDLSLSAGANMVFTNTSYFGFSPSLSIETSTTRSNIDLFDRRSVAVRMGVQSNF
ncbi:MAG: DUF560 domain-containing protein [Marinosulfonomonas sp.]|nr:DUF560 domain-containing protein [Marinosulfonomonas sp.]